MIKWTEQEAGGSNDGSGFKIVRRSEGAVQLVFEDIDPYMGGALTITAEQWTALVEKIGR